MCSVEVHGYLKAMHLLAANGAIGVGGTLATTRESLSSTPSPTSVNILEPLISKKVSFWKLEVLEMSRKIGTVKEAWGSRKEGQENSGQGHQRRMSERGESRSTKCAPA